MLRSRLLIPDIYSQEPLLEPGRKGPGCGLLPSCILCMRFRYDSPLSLQLVLLEVYQSCPSLSYLHPYYKVVLSWHTKSALSPRFLVFVLSSNPRNHSVFRPGLLIGALWQLVIPFSSPI